MADRFTKVVLTGVGFLLLGLSLSACNSNAEMRFWCLKQANAAVCGGPNPEEDRKRIQFLYDQCATAYHVR